MRKGVGEEMGVRKEVGEEMGERGKKWERKWVNEERRRRGDG